jgi:hypothetical protein
MSEVIPPFPQYAFMAWCLVKHRDNFTFNIVQAFREGTGRGDIPN